MVDPPARVEIPQEINPASIETPSESQETALPASDLAARSDQKRLVWKNIRFGKIALFGLSLFLFIQAIILMKESARGLAPLIQTVFNVSNIFNSFGFGWLMAYVIMSGSPVAAASLAFFDVGVISKLDAFAMITGSRLGANFIVILIGFLYVLRGRDRATSLSMGLLSLVITTTTQIPALLLGTVLLNKGWLDTIQFRSGVVLQSATDILIEPVTMFFVNLLPDWAVFLVGLGTVMLSFHLFDRCLPQMALKESQIGWTSRLVYRPIVMFALGALVTLISMSVSISLGILVPLSNRGFVRRENVIPYIMGANITTFIDTLLAAVLLRNQGAFTIVFVEMFTITLISLIILFFFYSRYQHMSLRFTEKVTSTNRNLAVFTAAIFLVPLILMLVH